MEIIVRKNDLVKELQLVQGIVERKNSIPILSNVLAEARGGKLRISATDLDVSLRCGCAAQVVEGGRDHPRRQEALRDRALPPGERRPDQGAAGLLGHHRVRARPASRWRGCPGRTSRPCPRAKAGKGDRDPGGGAAGPHQPAPPSRSPPRTPATTWRGPSWSWTRTSAAMVATDGHRLSYARRRRRCAVAGARCACSCRARRSTSWRGSSREKRRSRSSRWRTTSCSPWGAASLASKMIEGQFPAFEKVIAVTGDKSVRTGRGRGWRPPSGA